jgi:replication factor C subunit 3/5
MDFLVKDLIKPNYYPTINNLKFHDDLIKILNSDDLLFDTLFYGPSGSGKLTLIMAYLQKIFGPSVTNLTPNMTSKSITNATTTKCNEQTNTFTLEKVGVPLSNNNLILINDSMNDESIQDFFRDYIEILGENINYIIVLHINRLKEKTRSMISRFIDARKSTTYVLATCNRLDQIEPRMKSRFESYIVPRPEVNQLATYLHDMIPAKFEFPLMKVVKIVESTKRDIKLSIIYVNQRLLEAIDPDLKKKSIDNFKYYLNCLIQLVIMNDLKKLPMIRTMILTIYQSSLTWNEYINKVLDILYSSNVKINDMQKIMLIRRTAELDHKVKLSKPNYIHYEAFIFMIFEIIHT